jgi:hypothetical protein
MKTDQQFFDQYLDAIHPEVKLLPSAESQVFSGQGVKANTYQIFPIDVEMQDARGTIPGSKTPTIADL